MRDQYHKEKPPVFTGGNDGISAENWKKNVKRIAMSLDANPVQMQRLATSSLWDTAGTWWDSCWTDEHKLTGTWDEFVTEFDRQFISHAVKGIKRQEFLSLKQEDMTVDQYADKFNELRAFCPGIMLSEDALAEQFVENLNPRYKGTVVPHLGNVSTLRQVIDIAKRT